MAAAPPHKEEFNEFHNFLINRLTKDGITVKINCEADDQTIAAENPDALVFATGARPFLPPIAGLGKPPFYLAEKAFDVDIQADDIVIIGGGQVGCELGEFLLGRGKKITIIEILPKICADVEFLNRKMLLKRLEELKTTIITGARITRVENGAIFFLDESGEEKSVSYGALVVAAGYQPDEAFFHSWRYASIETHFIGDCVGARGIYAAVREGHDIGCRV
jgi:pyruvate/2-oxoglutarate dehydrogenase complex dihydrolipoamide dehydrogenase (E3) component